MAPAVTEHVILVDENDGEIGHEEKLLAHVTSRLHRAVSVFVCSPRGDMLMQQRAEQKYHSPGLWSNTCCGHPRPGERSSEAAGRRLSEEMGIECRLHPTSVLKYCVEVGADLVEHELNHVFVGEFDGMPHPDPAEVSQWAWFDSSALRLARSANPSTLTPWFEIVLTHLSRWAETSGASLPPQIMRVVRAWA